MSHNTCITFTFFRRNSHLRSLIFAFHFSWEYDQKKPVDSIFLLINTFFVTIITLLIFPKKKSCKCAKSTLVLENYHSIFQDFHILY